MRHGQVASLEDGVVGGAHAGQDIMAFGADQGFNIRFLDTRGYVSPVDSTPDKNACTSALAAQKYTDFEADVRSIGRWWCVRTLDGYVGALQVNQLFVDAPQRILLNYVLWN
ncbi:hypothetical protein ACGFI4_31215 [Micromonospora carbonacea]|uniref:hypothetical protein n=1 Tax=Micromonospora carbonacea TaxID=47853 RepID=UPI003715CFFC